MHKNFEYLPEAARERIVTEGYYEWVSRRIRSGGPVMIICGIVFVLLGGAFAFVPWLLISGLMAGESIQGAGTPIVVLSIFALLCFLAAVFTVRSGIRRSRMNSAVWIQKSAKASGYSESVMAEFGNQMAEKDAVIFYLAGKSKSYGLGNLTRDFVAFGNPFATCVIKYEDVERVCLAKISSTRRAGEYKLKTVHDLYLAAFSNHLTYFMVEGKEENLRHLMELLVERKPEIDTMGGQILPEKEYFKIENEFRKKMKSEQG